MNFQQYILVVAALAIAIVGSDSASIAPKTNLNLLSVLARSNDAFQRNPSQSLQCFNYYVPLLDQLARGYEEDYEACVKASNDKNSEVEQATLANRKALAELADDSCSSLSRCQHLESVEKVFECYISGGSENANKMRDINANASGNLFDLQEQLRLVKNNEYLCTNETKRAYERDNAQALDDLNKCILGGKAVPTTTSTTTEAAVVSELEVEPEAQPEVQPEVPSSSVAPVIPDNSENHEDVENPAENETPGQKF